MKYMGSKASIAKDIIPIILRDRKENQYFVEPFMGGCNSLDKVNGKRIGNDINTYLVEFWKAVVDGWIPPLDIDKEQYTHIKNNKLQYPEKLVGWVGFGCSYMSILFFVYI